MKKKMILLSVILAIILLAGGTVLGLKLRKPDKAQEASNIAGDNKEYGEENHRKICEERLIRRKQVIDDLPVKSQSIRIINN